MKIHPIHAILWSHHRKMNMRKSQRKRSGEEILKREVKAMIQRQPKNPDLPVVIKNVEVGEDGVLIAKENAFIQNVKVIVTQK